MLTIQPLRRSHWCRFNASERQWKPQMMIDGHILDKANPSAAAAAAAESTQLA